MRINYANIGIGVGVGLVDIYAQDMDVQVTPNRTEPFKKMRDWGRAVAALAGATAMVMDRYADFGQALLQSVTPMLTQSVYEAVAAARVPADASGKYVPKGSAAQRSAARAAAAAASRSKGAATNIALGDELTA